MRSLKSTGKITRNEAGFPIGLRGVAPKIKKLNYLGEWDESLFTRSIAIVGSRRMNDYGRRVIEKIVPVLVEAGVTIVSGMMFGVDQEAHRVALDNEGRTVGVLAWGIGWDASSVEGQVREEEFVMTNNLLVSEYEDGAVPHRFTFLDRNRIVVGLSHGVIVVQGAVRSGSMGTARLARKFGRKLMAVPGEVTSSISGGTNLLIKEGKAEMVRDGGDVLSVMGWGVRSQITDQRSQKEEVLVSEKPETVDEIARRTRKAVSEVSAEMGRLELLGEVVENGGKYARVKVG